MRLVSFIRNAALGAVIGGAGVFFAARGGAQAIHFDWAIYGAVAGAAGGVLLLLVPRMFRAPKDWPTVDEFRRGQDGRRRAPPG